jgi:hypothetical protein
MLGVAMVTVKAYEDMINKYLMYIDDLKYDEFAMAVINYDTLDTLKYSEYKDIFKYPSKFNEA